MLGELFKARLITASKETTVSGKYNQATLKSLCLAFGDSKGAKVQRRAMSMASHAEAHIVTARIWQAGLHTSLQIWLSL